MYDVSCCSLSNDFESSRHRYTYVRVQINIQIEKEHFLFLAGKPFIELSLLKMTVARSNTVHFKYLKLLLQEFVFCADQGLIVSIFAFLKPEKVYFFFFSSSLQILS